MKPAVDRGQLGATLLRRGLEPVYGAVANSDNINLAPILARLSDMPDSGVQARVEAANKFLVPPTIKTMSDRFLLGSQLEKLISSWHAGDALHDLVDHLTIAIALNNLSSAKCISTSLGRAFQTSAENGTENVEKYLVLLLESALFFYNTTDVDFDLIALRDVFHDEIEIPFPLLIRVGARLLAGNKDSTQSIEPQEMIETVFSPQRIFNVSNADLRNAVNSLIAGRNVEDWAQILSSLYFDSSATPEFADSCRTFLKLCFGENDPPLVLVYFKPGEDSWLARTSDLEESVHAPHKLYEIIQARGVRAPEFGGEQDNIPDDFLERVAGARRNGKEWIQQRLANVIPFRARGEQ